jgi:hypothetical protein
VVLARDERAARASDLREGDRDEIDPIPMGEITRANQAFESNRWN